MGSKNYINLNYLIPLNKSRYLEWQPMKWIIDFTTLDAEIQTYGLFIGNINRVIRGRPLN